MHGRLLRFNIEVRDNDASPIHRFRIVGCAITGTNRYIMEDIDESHVPAHAILQGQSY